MSEQDRPPIIPIPKLTPDGPKGGVVHRGINPDLNSGVTPRGLMDSNRLSDAGLYSGRGQNQETVGEGDQELEHDLEDLATGTGVDYPAKGSQPRRTKD